MQKKFFEKISRTFKSTTISHTFECTTNSHTVDVQALYMTIYVIYCFEALTNVTYIGTGITEF